MKSSVAPLLFSKHFGVAPSELSKLGVFDPTLNIDTLLFPDPILAGDSAHPEFRKARENFEGYFEKVRRLLLHSNGDTTHAAWRTAYKLLSFPEIKGTCLGYGSSSISGSGAGPEMTRRLMKTGFEIAQLGIDDPDLFMAMGLFEEDFGPDLIGDMFTNVAFGDICEFNRRIYSQLKIATHPFIVELKSGLSYAGTFAINPTVSSSVVPVILLPLDILRDLPVALDWGGVQEVGARNKAFRDSLNDSISALWSKKTLEGKGRLKAWALSSSTAFGDLLDMLHGMDGKPYDFAGDKLGELIWRSFADRIIAEHPFKIVAPKLIDAPTAIDIVDKILNQFIHLVEKRDIWREFYAGDGKPRIEGAGQRLFYITAKSYCDANNLDITPEAETGRGPVDFKFSQGISTRILVELKLSVNTKLVQGYEKQLAAYNAAESPISSKYVIIDVGSLKSKLKRVQELREKQILAHGSAPDIIVVDALPKVSASKIP